MNLLFRAFLKFFLGLIIVCLLLFVPAGTFEFWNAWLLIALLFVPMFIVGIILLLKSPELLEKRLNSKEKETEQKQIIILSAILFIIAFIIAAFDFRFKWSNLPIWSVIVAAIVLLLSYILYVEVMRENKYISRTVEIQENQKVVDNGLYGIVRHPMYSATILLFLSIPIVLGSSFSFIIFLFYPILIIKRIKNEEDVLEKELRGYIEYKKKVKYRIVPFIW